MQTYLGQLDLNCDLGEGEAPARTRALMRIVSSANIACGGHAGDLASMRRCVRLARDHGAQLGAHPGIPDRDGFGRADARPSTLDLSAWLLQQVGTLAEIARQMNAPLHHIKLHGALYHASEADIALARTYIQTVKHHFPGVIIYARSGGRVARLARRAGIEVWEEIFVDRAYLSNGQLQARGEPGALLSRANEVTRRLQRWLRDGGLDTVDGGTVKLRARTLCVHGDSPAALALAKAARTVLRQPG
jgi:UPF0271 protein